MSEALFEAVITRHRRRRRKVRRIIVDLDVTDDPTHGAQQLSFFNGFYHGWCYLPLLAFLTFDRESEQYLCAAALRPGNAPTQRGALPMLKRIVHELQECFPTARILVRLDGGFAEPELFTFLDEIGADYVVGLAKNNVLERRAALDMIAVRDKSLASGHTEHRYTDLTYGAATWDRERRVILKAEVVQLAGREMRDNPRFVVTNLKGAPRRIYQRTYCQRGEIENRIKELFDVALDRTSCSRFRANQLLVLLAAAAYVLLQELRLAARGTAWARAQVATLRLELLKIGVQASLRCVASCCGCRKRSRSATAGRASRSRVEQARADPALTVRNRSPLSRSPRWSWAARIIRPTERVQYAPTRPSYKRCSAPMCLFADQVLTLRIAASSVSALSSTSKRWTTLSINATRPATPVRHSRPPLLVIDV